MHTSRKEEEMVQHRTAYKSNGSILTRLRLLLPAQTKGLGTATIQGMCRHTAEPPQKHELQIK